MKSRIKISWISSYRAVNFPIDTDGDPMCPNGKSSLSYSRPVRGNKYGRTEEFYQCEDCSNCLQKEKCCKCKGNRKIRLNEELTKFHKEVLCNLNSIHGALLRMNRSIQSEGANGDYQVEQVIYQSSQKRIKSLEFRNCDDFLWF